MKRGTLRLKSVFRIQRGSSLHAATWMTESSGWESLERSRERGAKFTRRRWGSTKSSAWMTTQCRSTSFQTPLSRAASLQMTWSSYHSSTTTRLPITTSCGTLLRERWLEFLSLMSMESSCLISQWQERCRILAWRISHTNAFTVEKETRFIASIDKERSIPSSQTNWTTTGSKKLSTETWDRWSSFLTKLCA